mmetsp:Transcript_28099/g.71640  ORF Transcript_28099/g.71640 Transcript_28099/m.71640 type:complete len:263 (+) Transcript_28099:323-1111(+)
MPTSGWMARLAMRRSSLTAQSSRDAARARRSCCALLLPADVPGRPLGLGRSGSVPSPAGLAYSCSVDTSMSSAPGTLATCCLYALWCVVRLPSTNARRSISGRWRAWRRSRDTSREQKAVSPSKAPRHASLRDSLDSTRPMFNTSSCCPGSTPAAARSAGSAPADTKLGACGGATARLRSTPVICTATCAAPMLLVPDAAREAPAPASPELLVRPSSDACVSGCCTCAAMVLSAEHSTCSAPAFTSALWLLASFEQFFRAPQ